MIRVGHLGAREVGALLVIASVSDVFLSYPQQLVYYGGSAGWMMPLISMLICLILWSLIAPVFDRHPGENVVLLLQRTLGRLASALFCVLVTAYLILNAADTLRLFTETVITTVLPRSPIAFVTIPFFLIVVFYAYMGIEGQSRIAWLLGPWLMLGVALLLALNGNWMNLDYIFPLLGKGIREVLYGGGIVIGVFSNLLFLSILSGYLRHQQNTRKLGYWTTLIIGLTYTIVTLVFILVFPTEGSMRTAFPLYQLARLIYIGRFIQRLEAAFVFIWVAMALIKIAMYLWVCSYLYAHLFRMPVYRPIVYSIALVVYSLSFLPESFVDTLELNTHYLLRYGWTIVIALPVLLLFGARLRKRKKEEDGDDQTSQAS